MIWCIRFVTIEAHLLELGFARIGETGTTIVFAKGDDIFVIRKPNVHGDLTEIDVVDVFDSAGLPLPKYEPHFGD